MLNTEVVDLKLKGFGAKNGSSQDSLEQYSELKREIHAIRDQPLNLNIHGLQSTFVQ